MQTAGGVWYLLRIRPYGTSENVVEGAVITFTEVTALKDAQAALRESATLRNLVDRSKGAPRRGRETTWAPKRRRLPARAVAAQVILEHDQSFDVILCDLMMPEMTGMDLPKWLAIHHLVLAERVIFMTGGAFTPKTSDYVARVGNVRLEKPFEAVKLERLVSELVAAATSRG